MQNLIRGEKINIMPQNNAALENTFHVFYLYLIYNISSVTSNIFYLQRNLNKMKINFNNHNDESDTRGHLASPWAKI